MALHLTMTEAPDAADVETVEAVEVAGDLVTVRTRAGDGVELMSLYTRSQAATLCGRLQAALGDHDGQ